MTTEKTIVRPKVLMKGIRMGTASLMERQEDQDGEYRITISCSSDSPYRRWFPGVGMADEILGHDEGEVDLSRAEGNQRMSLNIDHDNQVQSVIGVIERLWLEDGRLLAEARLGNTDLANEVKQQMDDGILSNVSIGYINNKWIVHEDNDSNEPPRVRVVDWSLLEVSIVSTPADPGVGLGRSNEDEHLIPEQFASETQPEPEAPHNEEKSNMTTPNETEGNEAPETKPRSEGAGAPAVPVAELMAIGRAHPDVNGIELAAQTIERREGEVELRAKISAGYRALQEREDNEPPREYERTPPADEVPANRTFKYNPELFESRESETTIDLTEKERSGFSIARAIHDISKMRDNPNHNSFELEAMRASRDTVHKAGNPVKGEFVIPEEVSLGKRVMTSGTAASGGNLVADDFMASAFIEYPYHKSVALPYAQVLDGVVGNVEIPKQTGTATVDMRPETDSSKQTASDVGTGQITLSPKRMLAMVDYSNTLLAQSTPAVETFVRNDIGKAITLEIDRLIINGDSASSSNEPDGVLKGITNAATGLTTKGNNGGAPTFKDVVDLKTFVNSKNLLDGSLAYVAPADLIGKLETTEKATNTAQFIYNAMNAGREVAGYPVRMSNQVPNDVTKGTAKVSTLIFGDWSQVIFARWAGVELTVDNLTGVRRGVIEVTATVLIDLAIRHQSAFSACKDFTVV